MTRTPLLRVALVLGAVVLTVGCSDGATTATPTSTPTATPAPSSTTPVDAYTALKPPVSPGIGSVDPALAQRAYEKARGLLALSLAEPGTLTGAGTDLLLEQLRVPDTGLSVAGLLTPRATAKGLGLRPLFARTVTLGAQPVEVVRSSYRGEEVSGLGGESAVRITWDGAVRYRVVLAGRHHEVAYSVSIAYVFGPVPGEPNGLQLVQAVPGTFHAAPVVTSCLAAGVLLPAAGAPTAADFGRGPWPSAVAGPACPV